MDNSNLEWRFMTKVVAIVDLVLSILSMIVALLLILAVAAATAGVTALAKNFSFGGTTSPTSTSMSSFYSNSLGNSNENVDAATGIFSMVTVVLIIAWLLVATFVLLTVAQMKAAVKLLSASEVGMQPAQSVEHALYWRKVSILLAVLSVLGCFTMPIFYALLILILRIGAIFVVYNFIKELLVLVNAGKNNCLENVNVTEC